MPVLNIYAMKAFRLNRTEVIAIICCISVAIGVVSGTLQKHKASDGREYIIESEYKYNWFEAYHECARHDSQLVAIDSEEKNTALVDLLEKLNLKFRDLWLGGNDQFSTSLGKDRPFVWAATGKNFTFTYWVDSEPNNTEKQEHCVHIYREFPYKWNDNECDMKMGLICEVKSYLKLKSESDEKNKQNNDVFLNELNTRLQNLEQMAKDETSKIVKLQNSIKSAVQKLVYHRESIVKSWWKKLQEQVNELSGQVKQSLS